MPVDVVEQVQGRVGARGFSAFTTAAVRNELRRVALDELIAESEALNGPVDAEELAELDRRLRQ